MIHAASTIAVSSTTEQESGPFKMVFPATLFDSTDLRWSVAYVTTSRDDLHPGRLVDGWETFCSVNGLRIGDEDEFTRVEAYKEQSKEDGKARRRSPEFLFARNTTEIAR